MRTLRQVIAIGALGLCGFSLALSPAACGGDKKEPNVPKVPEDAAAGTPVSTGTGAQVGISGGPEAKPDLDGDAKVAYDRGFKAWMTGDLKAAKEAFGEAVEKAPKSGAAHYSLGTVLERLGDTAGAQGSYRQAFTVQPTNEFAMGALALSLARTGHGGEAETLLSDKVDKNPGSIRLMVFLGEVKSLGGDSAGAQKLAQQALAKDSTFKEAMLLVARDYYRARRLDVALYALKAKT